jgi:glycosyltransferase involved in cell wall biosynthesis
MSEFINQGTPRISIVMPSFNQAAYLEAAICSVLDQDYPDIELIVVDGGSTDGSTDILERYSDRIAYWKSAPDGGQSDALNMGFGLITGDIVGWLNSDDTYNPGAFGKVARVFEDPGVAIAMSSRFGFMDAEGAVYDYKENSYTDHKTLVRYWTTGGMTINQPCVFFRRHLLKGLDPVCDEDLHYAMDYDLWLRLTRESGIQVVEGHWANYRFHDTSKSGAGFDQFLGEWYTVSRSHWIDQGFWACWGHALHYFCYHYPMRVVF